MESILGDSVSQNCCNLIDSDDGNWSGKCFCAFESCELTEDVVDLGTDAILHPRLPHHVQKCERQNRAGGFSARDEL